MFVWINVCCFNCCFSPPPRNAEFDLLGAFVSFKSYSFRPTKSNELMTVPLIGPLSVVLDRSIFVYAHKRWHSNLNNE